MTEELRIEYYRVKDVVRWSENPKQHDIGALVASIRRYGMIDSPKRDNTLNGGTGALVYGNGREEALEWMQAQGESPPRGIRVDATGDWWMPITIGLDAASEHEAKALAIDHNNLTMAGGSFTALDMSRMWGDGYTDILTDLAAGGELPLTIDGDDLDLLRNVATPNVEFKEYDESVENEVKYCTCPKCGERFPA